jgi:hypothetical protein
MAAETNSQCGHPRAPTWRERDASTAVRNAKRWKGLPRSPAAVSTLGAASKSTDQFARLSDSEIPRNYREFQLGSFRLPKRTSAAQEPR